MENYTYPSGNGTLNFKSVPELAKQLELYKISQFIYNYLAVPISIWGWIGNFFSFK